MFINGSTEWVRVVVASEIIRMYSDPGEEMTVFLGDVPVRGDPILVFFDAVDNPALHCIARVRVSKKTK